MQKRTCPRCGGTDITIADQWLFCFVCHIRFNRLTHDLERWARWSEGLPAHGGNASTLIGRLMVRTKTVLCPQCWGTGKVKGVRVDFKKCSQCKGKGRIRMDHTTRKINPHLIHGTNPNPVQNDYIMERLDRHIKALPVAQRNLLYVQYFESGNQAAKAQRLKLTPAQYSTMLHMIYRLIINKIKGVYHGRLTW